MCLYLLSSSLNSSAKVCFLTHGRVLFIAMSVVCCYYSLQQECLCSSKQGTCCCWLMVSGVCHAQMGRQTCAEQ